MHALLSPGQLLFAVGQALLQEIALGLQVSVRMRRAAGRPKA
ncbi:MAG: hypothetical protein WKG03_13360 [Telluria sp.]